MSLAAVSRAAAICSAYGENDAVVCMMISVASMPPTASSSAKSSTRPNRSPRSTIGRAKSDGSPTASTMPRRYA